MQKSKAHEAPFVRKINKILENKEHSDIIRWDESKTMIDILDVQQMEQKILPNYFRHNKFPSFIRQLNLYGFKKIRSSCSHRFGHSKLAKGEKLLDIGSRKRFVEEGSSPEQCSSNAQPQEIQINPDRTQSKKTSKQQGQESVKREILNHQEQKTLNFQPPEIGPDHMPPVYNYMPPQYHMPCYYPIQNGPHVHPQFHYPNPVFGLTPQPYFYPF